MSNLSILSYVRSPPANPLKRSFAYRFARQQICKSHPDLLARLESSSPLKDRATRYGGRVGPILESGAPSGTAAADLARVRHLSPMLSLENAMTEEDVEKWLAKMLAITGEKEVEVVAEPKLDGLALSLRYEFVEGAGGGVYELVR